MPSMMNGRAKLFMRIFLMPCCDPSRSVWSSRLPVSCRSLFAFRSSIAGAYVSGRKKKARTCTAPSKMDVDQKTQRQDAYWVR